jgi:hypothetical protein
MDKLFLKQLCLWTDKDGTDDNIPCIKEKGASTETCRECKFYRGK